MSPYNHTQCIACSVEIFPEADHENRSSYIQGHFILRAILRPGKYGIHAIDVYEHILYEI
jgi:hypothetical protein